MKLNIIKLNVAEQHSRKKQQHELKILKLNKKTKRRDEYAKNSK